MTSSRILSLSTLLSCSLWGASCGSSSDTAPVVVDHTPSTLAAVSTTSPFGAAGTALDPIAVRVTTRSGDAVSGASVSFRVVAGGGAVNPATATTNDQGVATTTWTLGPLPGSQSISASFGNLPPVTFTAQAATGAAASLAKIAGDAQLAAAGLTVSTVPVVRVVDVAGNAVAGATVTFAVASGGGSVSGATATSAADGTASPTAWTMGTTLGANTLSASVGSASTTFTATAIPGSPKTLTFAPPPPSELMIGDHATLTMRAFDAYGNENTSAATIYNVSPFGAVNVDATGNLVAVVPGSFTVTARSGNASATYTAAVIGHPLALQVAGSIYTGGSPESMAVTDAGVWTINTNGFAGTLSHFDLTGTLVNTPVPVQSAALGYLVLAPSTTGNTVIVTNIGALASEFWFVDIASNTIVDSITTQRYVQFAAMSSDGRRAYAVLDAGELAVIDVPAHKFLPSIPLGAGVQSFIMAHGDSSAYAYSSAGTMFEIDLARGVIKRQFSMASFTDIDVSRDGAIFYALDDPALLTRILRTSDQRQIGAFIISGSQIAAAPDGRALFVITSGGSGYFVQSFSGDATNGYVLGPSFTSTDTPVRLLFDSYGSTLFVVNGSGTVDLVRAPPCTTGACRPPTNARRRPPSAPSPKRPPG